MVCSLCVSLCFVLFVLCVVAFPFALFVLACVLSAFLFWVALLVPFCSGVLLENLRYLSRVYSLAPRTRRVQASLPGRPTGQLDPALGVGVLCGGFCLQVIRRQTDTRIHI